MSESNSGLVYRPEQKIAVLHASVGSGHRVAAEAIAAAVEHLSEICVERFPSFNADVTVELFDILDFGRIRFDGDKAASMFTGPTRPIYDLTWRYFLTGRLIWGGGTVWSHIMFGAFTRWVRENKPVAVVCTHITAANVAVGARMIARQDYSIICVPTDYEIEGMWPHRYTDIFCVATESMAETLRARKVEEERILVTGLPARAKFRVGYGKAAMRELWNVPPNKHIALILAGATLPRPYVNLRTLLEKALPQLARMPDLHLLFMVGRDNDYARHLQGVFEELGVQNASIISYTEDVAKLMAASDFAICKPGGLTVTECICTETPMLLAGQAYGQEKANVRLLTSLGAAQHVQTAGELVEQVRYLTLPQSGRLAAMSVVESYLRRPDAALEIGLAGLDAALSPKDPDHALRHSQRPFLSFYWGHKPAHTR
ncbi:MAG: UDP-N-acetylglucosamine--LPS N-acetylglucosamine transferase [Coriobacteriales bacterium]|jgi:processive 1,2-diacylglycerol beta-glucosyltransferase|nr:UDP-N-acetylglucosamine--LPS N-acetylglucosamine transferase [Coriobacteriales bacterium]